jgi:apolipoprotein N-acyltransferase
VTVEAAKHIGQRLRAPASTVGAAAASGLLLAAAQNIRGLGWMALFCLVPLCLKLKPARLGRTWMALSITVGLATALTLWWIRLTAPGFIWLVPVAALYATLFTGIIALSCRAAGSILVLPAAWMVAEIAARRLFFGVTWTLLGLPLADWGAFSQMASLAGPEALSFAVASINVALVYCWRCRLHWIIVPAVLQGPVLAAALTLWGAGRIAHVPEATENLRAGVVQPCISDAEWDSAKRPVVLERLRRLIDSVSANANIVVLPEVAITGYVRYEDDLTAFVKDSVARTYRPLLFGTLDRTQDASQASNVAILMTPFGDVTMYRKLRMVPVAERTPRFFGWPRRRPGKPEWTPGTEQTIFGWPDGPRFAVLICWEDIFPDLARGAALSGAGLLIALINTEPFAGTAQPMQHLRRARLTAISSGLPLLRVADTGVTCWIGRDGSVRQSLAPGKGGTAGSAAVFEVPTGGLRTVYSQFGDFASVAAGLVLVAVIGTLKRAPASFWANRRSRRPRRHRVLR